LVVTHGLVMKVMLGELVKRPHGVSAPEHFGNTSVSVFDASSPYLTRLIDCTKHLNEDIAHNQNTVAGV
jgi:broad specificity phosphatase PhoE